MHLPEIFTRIYIHPSSHPLAPCPLQWINDFEVFQAAVENDTSYSSSLSRSLCLVLDEFYRNMPAVGVSAITGAGMKEFFQAVDDSAEEYMNTYRYMGRIIHVQL